jgi:hypothetical protein
MNNCASQGRVAAVPSLPRTYVRGYHLSLLQSWPRDISWSVLVYKLVALNLENRPLELSLFVDFSVFHDEADILQHADIL